MKIISQIILVLFIAVCISMDLEDNEFEWEGKILAILFLIPLIYISMT